MIQEPAVIVSVNFGNGLPDFALAAERLGVTEADIDPDFGILPVGIGSNVYALRVSSARLQLPRPGVEGPFSDPPIEPLG